MVSTQIRIANKSDLPNCVNLSKNSWPDWWSKNKKLGEDHIKNCIKEKTCLVATKGREVVAFLVWRALWNKIHIQDLFVEEKYRQHKIGTELIAHTAEIARKKGFKEIMSDCDVSNKVSISFHLNNGFEKCGYIKNNWDNENSYVFSRKIKK